MALTAKPRVLTLVWTPGSAPHWVKPVVKVKQKGTNVCWAACVESALVNAGNTQVSQYDLAGRYVDGCVGRDIDRGDRVIAGTCNKIKYENEMTCIWGDVGFDEVEAHWFEPSDRGADDRIGKLLKREIVDKKRPVQAWVEKGGHGVMVYGYSRNEYGKESAYIMNPRHRSGHGWETFGTRQGWRGLWTGLTYTGR